MEALAEILPPVVAERADSEAWKKINSVDRVLAKFTQQEMPLHHTFSRGLYGRSILIPADTFATTRVHLFEHQFVISIGSVSVWNGEGRWQTLHAGHIGVTKEGTRRIIYAHTDVVWHSFHVTDETDTDKLVDQLTFDPAALGHLDDVSPEQMEAIRAIAKPRKQLA